MKAILIGGTRNGSFKLCSPRTSGFRFRDTTGTFDYVVTGFQYFGSVIYKVEGMTDADMLHEMYDLMNTGEWA